MRNATVAYLILSALLLSGGFAVAAVSDPASNVISQATAQVAQVGQVQEDYIQMATGYVQGKLGSVGQIKGLAKAAKKAEKAQKRAEKLQKKAEKAQKMAQKAKKYQQKAQKAAARAQKLKEKVDAKVEKAQQLKAKAQQKINQAKELKAQAEQNIADGKQAYQQAKDTYEQGQDMFDSASALAAGTGNQLSGKINNAAGTNIVKSGNQTPVSEATTSAALTQPEAVGGRQTFTPLAPQQQITAVPAQEIETKANQLPNLETTAASIATAPEATTVATPKSAAEKAQAVVAAAANSPLAMDIPVVTLPQADTAQLSAEEVAAKISQNQDAKQSAPELPTPKTTRSIEEQLTDPQTFIPRTSDEDFAAQLQAKDAAHQAELDQAKPRRSAFGRRATQEISHD